MMLFFLGGGEELSEEYYSCFLFLESDHLTLKGVAMLFYENNYFSPNCIQNNNNEKIIKS